MPINSLRMSPGAHVHGDDVASADALALGYGDYFDITGNTAISSIATKKPGDQAVLHFVTGLTLNHSENLVMPGEVDLACPAESNAVLAEFEEGKWRLISFLTSEGHIFPVSNVAYGPSWENVDTIGASKNALFNKIETLADSGVNNDITSMTGLDDQGIPLAKVSILGEADLADMIKWNGTYGVVDLLNVRTDGVFTLANIISKYSNSIRSNKIHIKADLTRLDTVIDYTTGLIDWDVINTATNKVTHGATEGIAENGVNSDITSMTGLDSGGIPTVAISIDADSDTNLDDCIEYLASKPSIRSKHIKCGTVYLQQIIHDSDHKIRSLSIRTTDDDLLSSIIAYDTGLVQASMIDYSAHKVEHDDTSGIAENGVNSDITSMTGLDEGGIPISKVGGGAASGVNADITSMTALDQGGIPSTAIKVTVGLNLDDVIVYATGLIDWNKINTVTNKIEHGDTSGIANNGANNDITSMTGLNNGGIPLIAVNNAAVNGANNDITSMTNLSDDGIPLAKVANAASDGANADITSMVGLSDNGIPFAKVANAAGSGANANITSMVGLSNDGIPLAKVANAASDGVNSDITSMTGLDANGIPVSKVDGAVIAGANDNITSMTGLDVDGIPLAAVANAAHDGANADITSMTGLDDGGIPVAKIDGAVIAGVNTNITSMTGLDNDGIPLAAVANAAHDGTNADITSMTGLNDNGIPVAKVDGAVIAGVNDNITSMTGLDADGIPLAAVANAASDGTNSDITSMTGLNDNGIPVAKVDGAVIAGVNDNITSMTGLDVGGIPFAAIDGGAASGVNADITSMTGLDADGIPLAAVANAASDGTNNDITSMTGLNNDGIPLIKVANAASDGSNADITDMTGLDDDGIPSSKILIAGADGLDTVIPDYGQISFPVTQVPAVDGHTLDDYEEGTFEAIVTIGPSDNRDYTTAETCIYTKIGRLVTVTGGWVWNQNPFGLGVIAVSNLPFQSVAGGFGTLITAHVLTVNLNQACWQVAGTSALYFTLSPHASAVSYMNDLHVQNGSGFYFNITYMASA